MEFMGSDYNDKMHKVQTVDYQRCEPFVRVSGYHQ